MQDTQLGEAAEHEASAYARELRRWREQRGLSMRALAELMAYDRSYVSHIEGCNLFPTEHFTRRAEDVLNAGGALWGRWEELVAARAGITRPASPPPVCRVLRTAEFVAWLADHSSSGFRDTYDAVATLAHRLESVSLSSQHAREHERASVSREQVAEALARYYRLTPDGDGSLRLYRARVDAANLVLSVLVEPSWLGAAVQLGTPQEVVQFRSPSAAPTTRLSDIARHAAIARLAEVEVAETILMNNPLYRLLEVDIGPQRLAATVTLADFAGYALTADLLESELVDAISGDGSARRGPTPLRDLYLPSTTAATALDQRECVGGPATLLAIARPARGSRPADFVLLIQERSARVVNVAGKLAVIPKAFHQPISEPADEADLVSTLERELEEELLGRQDLEQLSQDSRRRADPLHELHRSEPMAWLAARRASGGYRTECVAYGINLVTGNYEFACLIVIGDEEWWRRFGHLVEANWEASRVRRYSSRDTDGLAALAADPQWSNEGLFAFLEGLRRLAQLDTGGRVAAPPIDVAV
jgi:transcriptional regulator with XRE-family HTH domain